jgi:hypothetical protein
MSTNKPIPSKNDNYQWAVIGAGPAGIAAVGKLLDSGIAGNNIAWIDPAFKVGDFGEKWQNVSSNTKVNLFLKFLYHCESFHYRGCSEKHAIHFLDPEQTCTLKYAAEPLIWVTERLTKQVNPIIDTVVKLNMHNRHWQITLQNKNIEAKNVIMAIGSEPKIMPISETTTISLQDALDKQRLERLVNKDDVVAVFGASHSAIIVIRLLLELGVKQVVNFYRDALRYAVYLDNWTLFDNTGLKGETAIWARENIDGVKPDNLIRVGSDEMNINQWLPTCNKMIQAVGFTPRQVRVEGLSNLTYNKKSGIIAPGLFGCGIAFPEETVDKFGNIELSVGLWKFMHYLDRVMPVWLVYGA